MSFLCANSGDVKSPAAIDELLREAARLRDQLNELSNRLSRHCPNDECFYATNRAWRQMALVIDNLRKLQ
jgi:hypothetical protein